MDTLYIVVPCYNEQECLEESAMKLNEIMVSLMDKHKISTKSKIVFVNDGSKDKTWNIIVQLNEKNKCFQGIKLSHNKGHQTAVIAGLSYACQEADIILSIDADLQDDVLAIEKMVDEYHNGNEIVYGVRTSRDTDTHFKRNTANLYYRFLKFMGIEIIDNHADFRLMSQRACKALLEYKEVNLFLRGMVPQLGFKSTIVGYERKKRTAGVSKYPLKKMLGLAWDGVTSFSIKPLRLITFLGSLISGLSLLCIIVFSILFLCSVLKATYSFYILLSIWLVCGILLIMLGIIGEYIGKMYQEVKARPRFFIEEIKK